MRLLTLFFSLLCVIIHPCFAATKTIYGYIESAVILPQNLTLPAKLDTGAKSSSLHAVDIQRIKKAGKSYVKFKVPFRDKEVEFISEYIGSVSIKARTNEATHIMRPVVMMKIRLGTQEQVVRVNLTNRAHFLYPLLLGREAIIALNGIVDPAKRYEVTEKASG